MRTDAARTLARPLGDMVPTAGSTHESAAARVRNKVTFTSWAGTDWNRTNKSPQGKTRTFWRRRFVRPMRADAPGPAAVCSKAPRTAASTSVCIFRNASPPAVFTSSAWSRGT